MLFKSFPSFEEGIQELAKVSFSAEQALTADRESLPITEEEAIGQLAANVACYRPTGNGVGWNRSKIEISAFEVTYMTSGGLEFGWRPDFILLKSGLSCFDGGYTFSIRHPKERELGEIPEDSTLLKSAREYGWEVE